MITRFIKWFLVLFIASSAIFPSLIFAGDCSSSSLRVEKALVVGEQSVSALYRLKVIPSRWVGRKSFWEKSSEISASSNFLSCPLGLIGAKSDRVKNALKEMGTSPVIITKPPEKACLYKPMITTERISKKMKSFNADPIVVDFSNGIEPGVKQLGKLFNAEKQAQFEIKKYKRLMTRAEKNMKEVPAKIKVAVISGVYQESTGKSFIRVELPGGYTDQFILDLVKAENVASKVFNSEEIKKADKGHIIIRGKKFAEILKAKPDLIAVTGDSYSVEKAFYKALRASGEKSENFKLFSLPFYAQADLLSYPEVLMKWSTALKEAGRK